MNKFAIVGIIFLVIIIIVLGLFAYSYTQLGVSLNNVEFQSIDWEPISWRHTAKDRTKHTIRKLV